jgi:enoyl-CoA hydratase
MLTECDDVRVTRRRAAGRITLDRPAKLNALTHAMVREMAAVLGAWANDSEIRTIVLDGTGPRAFCAGGDVQTIYHQALAGDNSAARQFWADEYRLDAQIARYEKPIVAFMAGIVMGGGVGLSAHTRHRIVTETTRFAMPEVSIGVIPDVGASWLFSRAPGELGTYLALTGESIGAADVLALGFADAFVPQASLEALAAELLDEGPADDAGVRAVIARFAAPAGAAVLPTERARIDALFGFETVEAILAALDADASPFALATAATMRTKSPTSLKLTLREVREARALPTLADCLRHEFRIISRVIEAHDFFEGVRAVVVDKDRQPRWQPADLCAVTPMVVNRFFAPLDGDELDV